DPAASRELHTIIASSTLTIYPGMGHSLPRSLWPDIVAEIRHVSAHNRDHHQPGHVATARRDPVGRSCTSTTTTWTRVKVRVVSVLNRRQMLTSITVDGGDGDLVGDY